MAWLPAWTEQKEVISPAPVEVAAVEPEQSPEVVADKPATRPPVRWEVATPEFLAWIDRGVTLKGLERSMGERFWEKEQS
jgi:hypothetical protein